MLDSEEDEYVKKLEQENIDLQKKIEELEQEIAKYSGAKIA